MFFCVCPKLHINNNRIIVSFCLIFTVLLTCNLLFLINGGIYWDDWCNYSYVPPEIQITSDTNSSFEEISLLEQSLVLDSQITHSTYQEPSVSSSVGRMKLFSLFSVFNFVPIEHPYIARLILFFAEVFAAFFLYLCLRFFELVKDWAIFLTLLSFTIPIYLARYTFCCLDYYMSLFFFYSASYFYLLNVRLNANNKILCKIFSSVVSLFFFLKSFQTASCFVYYIVPFAAGYIYLYGFSSLKIWEKKNIKHCLVYVRDNIVFFILPFVLYLVKVVFFSPTGDYITYYSLKIDSILRSPLTFLSVFADVTTELLIFSLTIAKKLDVPLLIIFVIVIPLYKMFCKKEIDSGEFVKINFVFAILSFLFIGFFATFAYSAIGRQGCLDYFDSRHLLLCGLAFSLLCFIILSSIFSNTKGTKAKFVKRCLILFIFIFSFERVYIDYKMYKEYLKQEFLVANIEKSEIIKNNEVFLINWNTDFALYSHLNFYETSGYAYKAFGTRNHLILDSIKHDQLEAIFKMRNDFDYKISDIHDYKPQGVIDFTFLPNKKDILISMYFQFFKKERFKDYVPRLGKFSVKLLNNQNSEFLLDSGEKG